MVNDLDQTGEAFFVQGDEAGLLVEVSSFGVLEVYGNVDARDRFLAQLLLQLAQQFGANTLPASIRFYGNVVELRHH